MRGAAAYVGYRPFYLDNATNFSVKQFDSAGVCGRALTTIATCQRSY